MTKPLRSADNTPKSVQFSHFGVLDDGQRSKGAAFTSIGVNLSLLLIILVVGAVVKNNPKMAKKLAEVYLPTQPPPPPPPPKMPPPPPPKNLPAPPRIEPKIKMPEPEKLPEIKPIEVPKPAPPVPAPAPPKAVTPPPAPVKVTLGNKAASVVNADIHPSAVSLGKDSPIKTPTGPSVSSVSLAGAGAPGMKGAGNGPHATAVNMGSGSPNSSNINASGKGSQVIAGVSMGTLNSNGPRGSKNFNNAPVTVGMGNQQVQQANRPTVQSLTAASPPKVLYKPKANYTDEAKTMHLEGDVSIRIKVLASGSVQVLGVVQGLGHGLDQSAVQAAQATRFKPAVDAAGNPVDWEGVVKVNFQMS